MFRRKIAADIHGGKTKPPREQAHGGFIGRRMAGPMCCDAEGYIAGLFFDFFFFTFIALELEPVV